MHKQLLIVMLICLKGADYISAQQWTKKDSVWLQNVLSCVNDPRHAFSQRSGIFKDILVSRQSHGLTPAAVSAGRSPTRRPAARRLPRASA